MNTKLNLVLLILLALQNSSLDAQQTLPLIDATQESGGWTFGNGPEFPGATGELKIAAESFRDTPVLALRGDFTAGGNYVQCQIALPDVAVDQVSFWVKAPDGADAIGMRIIDGSDQCHQLKLKINAKGGWQQIVLPVEEFFRTSGTSSALDIAASYEKWGGANDGRWHQPGKSLVFLCSRNPNGKAELLISDVRLQPAQPQTSISRTIPLDALIQQGELDWEFHLGQEFPGAKGGTEIVRDVPNAGANSIRLQADFTSGGAYVGVRKSLAALTVESMNAIRMRVRSESTTQFSVRLIDGTGQCHQRKTIPVTADGKWHDIVIVPKQTAGGEHWGGANDGKWHDSVQAIELMLNKRSSEELLPAIDISDIRADVKVAATSSAASFRDDFDSTDAFADSWKTNGDARVSDEALRLSRTLSSIQTATGATTKPFDVLPGVWQIRYAWSCDLHSPDNSYHGSVALEVLDSAGTLLEAVPVGVGSGKHDWSEVSRTIKVPNGAAKARFRVELKKTYGWFGVDALTISRLKVQPVEDKVDRVLLATDAVGNLFLPEDEVAFHVTVESKQPLLAAERLLSYRVRDYWDAEVVPPNRVQLSKQARQGERFIYTADIRLANGPMAIGKYHELHVTIPIDSEAEVTEYTGFARLPVAVTKQFRAEDVPFTIRNWDSRVPAYFHLADRLGLRMIGVWGGWSPKSPYEPALPGIEICEELSAKWITGTPAAEIERNGFMKYSEESLRTGMKNFLETYADRGLAMIAMGNEPHGTGDKVLENVRAYKAIHETVKAFDPDIHVIGTSVEPNEEYFKTGYQNYLDSYDFHIYEHYTGVRRTMREYRDLMEKYDAVKPIHSTELGLNSQGQTRLAVSREMIRKIVSFFAAGGETASWFTIQYPDPTGTARGQFGDSHCMFDCKYNLYNPRLDAITHYHLVNAIGIKKFVSEKRYDGGTQACLFRDGEKNCLQVLWSDDQPEVVSLPFTTGHAVRLIAIDGAQKSLVSEHDSINVTVTNDPIMLLYDE